MNYRQCLESLRDAFPRPTSDRQHDAYFVFAILRALDQVDSMKSTVPILGKLQPLDYVQAAASRMRDDSSTVEEVTELLARQLEGISIVGHPLSHTNVNGTPSIAAIIGNLLPTIYNPNLVTDASGRGLLVAEQAISAMMADLIGYDPQQTAGVFTFGGTGTNLYAARIGIEKAFPGAMQTGLPAGGVVLASDQSHYCRMSVAGWLGLGENNAIAIPTGTNNEMDLQALEQTARQTLESGQHLVCLIATMGTTDSLGIDDLQAIVELRDRLVEEYQLSYRPHVHADAVIGWAWSVFNDYDFNENSLGFRPRANRSLAGVSRRMAHLCQADSLGIDFHKTGFAPYISSLLMVRDKQDLSLLERDRAKMPYLFNTGQYHPGTYTLETSRSGSGVLAAFASLHLLGKSGLRSLLGHMVDVAEQLREHLEGHSTTSVVNDENFGTVTLFRVYPKGVDTWTIKQRERSDPDFVRHLRQYNEYNRKVFQYLEQRALQGDGPLLSLTDCYRTSDYGEPIVAMKSYIMSPFVEYQHVEDLLQRVIAAQHAVDLSLAPAGDG
ncbi:MAG: pyridoxal-dependent decarboxylase [Pirellulales bacterium]|nr:pyridoxal-dependent decarboxylase [Pirellulales bacterium]